MKQDKILDGAILLAQFIIIICIALWIFMKLIVPLSKVMCPTPADKIQLDTQVKFL